MEEKIRKNSLYGEFGIDEFIKNIQESYSKCNTVEEVMDLYNAINQLHGVNRTSADHAISCIKANIPIKFGDQTDDEFKCIMINGMYSGCTTISDVWDLYYEIAKTDFNDTINQAYRDKTIEYLKSVRLRDE